MGATACRTRYGLRGAFLLMGVIAALPVAFGLGVVLRARRKGLTKA